jgi:hypothetical protein
MNTCFLFNFCKKAEYVLQKNKLSENLIPVNKMGERKGIFLKSTFLIFVGTIAPAREIPGDESEVDSNEKFMKALQYFFTNVNLVLPVVAAVVVIVSAIVFICVFRSRHTQMLAGKKMK